MSGETGGENVAAKKHVQSHPHGMSACTSGWHYCFQRLHDETKKRNNFRLRMHGDVAGPLSRAKKKFRRPALARPLMRIISRSPMQRKPSPAPVPPAQPVRRHIACASPGRLAGRRSNMRNCRRTNGGMQQPAQPPTEPVEGCAGMHQPRRASGGSTGALKPWIDSGRALQCVQAGMDQQEGAVEPAQCSVDLKYGRYNKYGVLSSPSPSSCPVLISRK